MEHTKNYNLPQWKKEDRIMMDDFNEMCVNIETGLSANAQAAAQAQQTADTLPYVVGSYTGSGIKEGQEIHLGFRPSFVIVCTDQSHTQSYYGGNGVLISGPTANSELLFLTDAGFRVVGDDYTTVYPQVNRSNKTYDYIAFR